MIIPRSYVEAYSKALNGVSEQGKAALINALGQLDYSLPVAEVREAIVAIMQQACGASTDMAARLASDFYDGLRLRFCIDDGFRATVDSKRAPEATEGAVRAFVQDLVDGKPVEQFVDKCVDRLDYETRRAANECVADNAKRDPKKPRWARVPTGSETCGFCFMLASRGFVYHSKEDASHAHARCDCRIIPSWDKKSAAVEGYDPQGMYDRWKACEATLGGRQELEKVWDELPEETQREWLDRHRKPNGKDDLSAAKEAFINNQVIKEVETRDWHWLYTGKAPKIDYSSITDAELRIMYKQGETNGHEKLSNNGFRVFVKNEHSTIANIDLLINGELWELKTIRGKGSKINARFNEAVSKWKRLHDNGQNLDSVPRVVIDNSHPESTMSDEIARKKIVDNLAFHADSGLREVILINRQGQVERIRSK